MKQQKQQYQTTLIDTQNEYVIEAAPKVKFKLLVLIVVIFLLPAAFAIYLNLKYHQLNQNYTNKLKQYDAILQQQDYQQHNKIIDLSNIGLNGFFFNEQDSQTINPYRLDTLLLDDNNLTSLNWNSFMTLSSMNLKNNPLSSFCNNIFTNLSKLQWHIQQTLQNFTDNELPALKSLNLSSSQSLYNFSSNILTSLTELNMSQNVFYISFNKIGPINKIDFTIYQHLVQFTFNQILCKEISIVNTALGFFSGNVLPEVTYMNLHYNMLIQFQFNDLPKIKYLNLSHNGLNDSSLTDIGMAGIGQSLETVDLRSNNFYNIGKVSKLFERFPNLQELLF